MSHGWAEALWRASWQGALAVAGVWLLCRLLRGLPANTRCWLWRLAFLKLLTALFWTAPLDLPLLPARAAVAPSPLTRTTPLPPPRSRALSDTLRRPATPSTAGSPHVAANLVRAIQFLWFAGVTLGLFGLAAAWRRTEALRRGAALVEDPGLLREIQEMAGLLGLRRVPAVLTYNGPMPLLIGALRPAVLLPRDLPMSPEERRLVLGHELAHARRRDLLWAWLPTLVRCLLFFHPLVWLAYREARLAQEAASDELTLRVTGARVGAYAQMLVDLTAGRAPALAGLGAAGILESGMLLERRLEMLEQIAVLRSQRWAFFGALLTVIGCGLVVPWRVVAQEPRGGGDAATRDLRLAAGINVAQKDDQPTPNDLGKIQPPGGVPLLPGGPGVTISVDYVTKATRRLEATPAEDLDRWVAELERIMDTKLDGELAKQACRTYFVTRVSLAFDDLAWNARTADSLFRRAQTMPPFEARAWQDAFEALRKKEIGQNATTVYDGGPAYAVPLVLIPVDALYEGHQYSAERGKKYLARLKQLTAEDVSLWNDRVDAFGGTELDAAVNIILLDAYFDREKFRRDKFRTVIGKRKK